MARIVLDFEKTDVQNRLAFLVSQLLDLRPFWPLVVGVFTDWMRQQFASEGQFAGTPWAPLSPEYLARKSVAHPGRPILQAEGDLFRASTKPDREALPQSLTLTIPWAREKRERGHGNEDLLVRWHQEGNTQGMPARPILFDEPLPPRASKDLDRVMARYVDDLIKRSGL